MAAATAESRSYGRSMAKAMVHFKDNNFSGFCEALAVGSLQDASISVTLAQPEEPDCPLIGVSKGFQLLTGYARDEVLGRNCRFLNRGCVVPKEERLRLRAAVRKGKKGGASFAGLLQNRRKNGEAFLNFLCIKTLRVGSLFYFLGFQVDMTHRSDSEHVQNLVQLELDAIVSTILYAQDDALSRLQVVEDFDHKAWLLRKEYDHANFASLEHDQLLTKNTFLEVQAEEDEKPLRRSVSDSIFEEGSNTSEEAFTKTLKILKDQADWLHEKARAARVKDEPELEEKTENTKLPSVGSQFHPDRCTPCSFHCYSLRGCLHGEACEFCHLEHLRRPKPKKRGRKKPEEAQAPFD
ncbi:PHOT2 [Symbiodinium sp. CCMP2456]|nr:PHOT2 [Symbiodinium sp. CCMP2456]